MKKLFLFILIPISLAGQTHHDWSYNLSIYEANVRQYTHAGTFNAFGTHLDRLKDLGVGIVWFMPINPIGVQNRLGSLGSPYSVKDYLGINPEFGTMEDFEALVDSIHAKGMYVIIDWVANHTSWDNALTVTNPEWYVRVNGNFVPPPGTNWSDVIQLDYSKQGLRDYMIDAMKFWITEADVDGFRCDAVSFMPINFWSEAIPELKSIKPGLFMLAEDDDTQYQTAGFDMSYGWGLLAFGTGILPDIYDGIKNANFINAYATLENTNFTASHYRMYFTSNHDENSWHGTVYELFGDAAENFAVLTSTFRSMPLIYGGQEAGLDQRLAFFDKDEIIWRPDPFASIYKTLFHLKRQNKALWNGTAGGLLQRVTSTDNPSIIAFIRQKEEDKVFEIFNLTDSVKTFTLQGTLYVGNYRDAFTNDSVLFIENTQMTLPAWGYKVYEYGSGITGVDDEVMLPEEFNLYQNYPNPFNPTTTIQFSIPKNSFVTLKVYDLLGKEVANIVDENMNAGVYEREFKADNLSSGIYFYSLSTDEFTQTKKLVLMK
ncbi:MAG TPA: alpha-amylase family glycosyl hydrolase [Ignavibacteriaceae bacterium]|nr:alpha-amylase family glycosyl hydrolase [Ignavibacteriaceae bacterium]